MIALGVQLTCVSDKRQDDDAEECTQNRTVLDWSGCILLHPWGGGGGHNMIEQQVVQMQHCC